MFTEFPQIYHLPQYLYMHTNNIHILDLQHTRHFVFSMSLHVLTAYMPFGEQVLMSTYGLHSILLTHVPIGSRTLCLSAIIA